MLDISSTLLDRVKSKLQTLGNNANPQMEIIAQKAAKYLNQGSFLTPRTVRTGNSLGPLDICIRREDKDKEPTEIIMLYIEQGTAKVATLPYVYKPTENFVYKYSIDPATDVACDFDGRWELVSDHTGIYFDTNIIWSLVTMDEPYFALVHDDNLTVQKGRYGEQILLETNVTKCALLRGWKSTVEVLTEQGIICAYIKTDGKAYYRNYCEQEDGSFNWEVAREITEFTPPVTNISLFLTADYRTGFLAEIDGSIHMMVTKRCWSGLAIIPEFVELIGATAFGEMFDIHYWETQEDLERVEVVGLADAIQYATYSPTLLRAWNIATSIEDPENPGQYHDDYGYRIIFEFDQWIANAMDYPVDFKIVDDYNITWYGQSAIANGRFVTVTFNDFNNAGSPITAYALAGNLTNGYVDLIETSIEFNAINLVPTYVPPPEVTNIYNIDAKTIIIEFDKLIVSIDSQSGFVVSANEPVYSPNGTLVNTTYGFDSVEMMPGTLVSETPALGSGIETNVEVV